MRTKMTMEVETNDFEKLKKIAENHIEYLIDFDSNKDIVSSVSNVHVMTTENKKG